MLNDAISLLDDEEPWPITKPIWRTVSIISTMCVTLCSQSGSVAWQICPAPKTREFCFEVKLWQYQMSRLCPVAWRFDTQLLYGPRGFGPNIRWHSTLLELGRFRPLPFVLDFSYSYLQAKIQKNASLEFQISYCHPYLRTSEVAAEGLNPLCHEVMHMTKSGW